jgi:hypothetical protein
MRIEDERRSADEPGPKIKNAALRRRPHYLHFNFGCQQNTAFGALFRGESMGAGLAGASPSVRERGSKLGKTLKSIPDDSTDSCHGVSLTLG